jgi:hypothetical protein
VRNSAHRCSRLQLQLNGLLLLLLLLLLHRKHHLLHSSQHIQLKPAHALLDFGVHLVDPLLKRRDLISQALNLALLVLRGRGAPATRGALNILEEIASAALEVFVEESDVLCRLSIKVTVFDRLGLHLAKAVKVKLVVQELGARVHCKSIEEVTGRERDLADAPDERMTRTCYGRNTVE